MCPYGLREERCGLYVGHGHNHHILLTSAAVCKARVKPDFGSGKNVSQRCQAAFILTHRCARSLISRSLTSVRVVTENGRPGGLGERGQLSGVKRRVTAQRLPVPAGRQPRREGGNAPPAGRGPLPPPARYPVSPGGGVARRRGSAAAGGATAGPRLARRSGLSAAHPEAAAMAGDGGGSRAAGRRCAVQVSGVGGRPRAASAARGAPGKRRPCRLRTGFCDREYSNFLLTDTKEADLLPK